MNAIRALTHDLISDIRFSQRKIYVGFNVSEEREYLGTCRRQLKNLFLYRHNVSRDIAAVDEWGTTNTYKIVDITASGIVWVINIKSERISWKFLQSFKKPNRKNKRRK